MAAAHRRQACVRRGPRLLVALAQRVVAREQTDLRMGWRQLSPYLLLCELRADARSVVVGLSRDLNSSSG